MPCFSGTEITASPGCTGKRHDVILGWNGRGLQVEGCGGATKGTSRAFNSTGKVVPM